MEKVEPHVLLSDDDFVSQFAACTLNPELFTHEAHLRLAWIHISHYGREMAVNAIRTQLLAFTRFLDAADKYNETLTVAAIHTVDHFMRRSSSATFTGFIEEFPKLRTDFKTLMTSHYSIDVFQSKKARLHYIEPNIANFD